MNKILFIFFCVLVCCTTNAQNQHITEKELLDAYRHISSNFYPSVEASDSLTYYNDQFEEKLISYLEQAKLISGSTAKQLKDDGLRMWTSDDNHLHIFNWDDNTGGTMRNFITVIQSKSRQGKYVVSSSNDEALINKIYALTNNNITYYLISKTAIGSSALSYEFIDIYQINNNGELIAAPIIKTSQHTTNRLGAEVDYSSKANDGLEERINVKTAYNPQTKEISIPLIRADGKITMQKIVYRFDGNYFIKK